MKNIFYFLGIALLLLGALLMILLVSANLEVTYSKESQDVMFASLVEGGTYNVYLITGLAFIVLGAASYAYSFVLKND